MWVRLMAKKNKGHKGKGRGIMGRSDIPYAQRLKMQQQSSIRVNREHAATITCYIMCYAMNELEGIGYKRLIRFAARYMRYENEFYQDVEVGMAHAKRRMEAMGMPISGEFFREMIPGKTVRQQEVHDNALQATQVALTVGAIAMNDEFGFGESRQLRISKRMTELSERYAREGEGFLVEKMRQIGFVVIDGRALAFADEEGNAITAKQYLKLHGESGSPTGGTEIATSASPPRNDRNGCGSSQGQEV